MAVPSTGRTPAGAGPPNPLDALDARVREAVNHMPSHERRALRMRESDATPYVVIAESLGLEVGKVAPLLVSARLTVREAVRGKPAPEELTEDCGAARELLCARQDGELGDTERAAWLREHVDACDACRATRLALREATVACRGVDLGSVATAPTDGVAVARQVAEAVAARRPVAPDPDAAVGGDVARRTAEVIVPARTPRPQPAPEQAPRLAERAAKRRRRGGLFGGFLILLMFGGAAAAAMLTVGGDKSQRTAEREARPPGTTVPARTPAATPDGGSRAGNDRARAAARRAAAARRRRERARQRAAAAPEPGATATPAATSTPESERRRRSAGGGSPADENAATEVDQPDRSGAGLPAPRRTPAPTTTAAPGQPPIAPDECTEDSPDCESG